MSKCLCIQKKKLVNCSDSLIGVYVPEVSLRINLLRRKEEGLSQKAINREEFFFFEKKKNKEECKACQRTFCC